MKTYASGDNAGLKFAVNVPNSEASRVRGLLLRSFTSPSHSPITIISLSKRYHRSVILPYCIAGVEDNEKMVKKVEGVKPPQRFPSSLTD